MADDGYARRDGADDRDEVLAVLLAAFRDDPVWAWMAPDPGRRTAVHATLVGPVVDAALHRGTLWVSPSTEAVAVYVPPGVGEVLPGAEVEPDTLAALVGASHAAAVLALFARFDAARPTHLAHYYLTLLATAAQHRGHGHGVRLLRETMERRPVADAPVYLESTNPANNRRYESLGFQPMSGLAPVDGCPPITTMWRPLAADAG